VGARDRPHPALTDDSARSDRPRQGHAAADDTSFEVSAERGSTENGICSSSFLEHAFRTDSFHMRVTTNPDGTWSYFEDTVLTVLGRDEPFHHTDRNTLRRIAQATPNPLARAVAIEA
jgi:hypothetical protein